MSSSFSPASGVARGVGASAEPRSEVEYVGDPRDFSRQTAVARLAPADDIEILPQSSVVVRMMDITIALILLTLVMPLLLGISLAIRLSDDRGPVLFRQPRNGYRGETFHMIKFRTMVPDATERLGEILSEDVALREDFETREKLRFDPRVSAVGNVLRPSGLDELPQLWNVLKGDMSIVGPRPLTMGEERRYGPYAPLLWTVKPGLTGPWQIGGRNDISYDERVAIDIEYVRERTLTGDLKILARTTTQFLTGRLRGGY